MKKLLLGLLLIAGIAGYAQDEMTSVYELKLEHKITRYGTGLEGDGEVSYAASDKQLSIFDHSTGQVKWTKAFKEIAPKLRKVDVLIPFWEGDIIFLFDRKVGKDQIACVDLKTGELLWTTEKYQNLSEDNIVYIAEEKGFAVSLKDKLVFIKARTGEEKWSTSTFKGVIGKYVWKDGFIVAVNFKPSGLGALFSGFKNQIAKINLTNGEIAWEQAYIGRAERKAITREFIFTLDLEDDMVVLKMNGIQTYSFKTGAKLWAAAFDFTAQVIRPPKDAVRFGVYGAVAEPLFDGDDVYVLDMSNTKSQYLKKYDKNSGKLLWTSAEIKAARAIPVIAKSGDKIILQIGGTVEAQARVKVTTKNADGSVSISYEDRIWYPDVKPWGLMAINTSNGEAAWRSERFKKGISNSFTNEGNVIVSSGKALYSIVAATGDMNYEKELKEDGIGRGEKIMVYNDQVIVIGSKGVSAHNISDGKLNSSGKYKKSFLHDAIGDYAIMKTLRSDIACFDLRTCKYKQFKARKGAGVALSKDGNFVYIYEKKTVTKLKTK